MKDYLMLLIIASFCLLSSTTKSQTLTEKDFHLVLDGKFFDDSTITIDELRKARHLTANFSWLKIESFTIDFSSKDGSGELMYINCDGDTICNSAREIIKKVTPGMRIIFIADKATNKSGVPLQIQNLILRVKE